jgi:hypothetical protein
MEKKLNYCSPVGIKDMQMIAPSILVPHFSVEQRGVSRIRWHSHELVPGNTGGVSIIWGNILAGAETRRKQRNKKYNYIKYRGCFLVSTPSLSSLIFPLIWCLLGTPRKHGNNLQPETAPPWAKRSGRPDESLTKHPFGRASVIGRPSCPLAPRRTVRAHTAISSATTRRKHDDAMHI